MRVGLGAGGLDGVHHFLGGLIAAHVVHHHVGAGLPESDRDGFSDSGVGPGHQCFLPFEQYRQCEPAGS